MIEVGDMVRCTGQLEMVKHTAGTPEDIDRMGSPRHGSERFLEAIDPPDGAWVVKTFVGRFAGLEDPIDDKIRQAWPTDQLMKLES